MKRYQPRVSSHTETMWPSPPVTSIMPLRMSIRISGKWEKLRKLSKRRKLTVTLVHSHCIWGGRPFNSNLRIVPRNTAFPIAVVVGSDLVDHLRRSIKRAITVRETYWHVKLLPIFCTQDERRVPPKIWRAMADVYHHIENASSRTAIQFACAEIPIWKCIPRMVPLS